MGACNHNFEMKRNWPGQVRPTIEDDDEDEDDPIVGCQQLLVTPKIPLLPILKLLKQLIDCS